MVNLRLIRVTNILIFMLLKIQLIACTIDINISQFQHIAISLNRQECRKLVASIHFKSYELPAALNSAINALPEDFDCFKLLLIWNSGRNPCEGYGKTHEVILHRLRQIGRNDLAEWLGQDVFHNLAKEVNDSLLIVMKRNKTTNKLPLYVDKKVIDQEVWTTFDSILWVVFILLVGATVVTCGRIVLLSFRSENTNDNDYEEMRDLLSNEDVEYSDNNNDCEIESYLVTTK